MPEPEVVVRQLVVYPIKGCQGVTRDAITVTPLGIEGDRRFALWRDGALVDQKETPRTASVAARLDDAAGTLTLSHVEAGDHVVAIDAGGERRPGKWVLDQFETIDQGDAAAEWLEEAIGEKVRLVSVAEPWQINFPIPQMEGLHEAPKQAFTAASPVSIANVASLEALHAHFGEAVPMERFRMNVIIEGLGAHEEDAIAGVENDAVSLRHITPAERCVIVSTDQKTGERDRSNLLRALPQKSKEERFGSGRIFGTYLQVERAGELRVGDRLRVLRS